MFSNYIIPIFTGIDFVVALKMHAYEFIQFAYFVTVSQCHFS